MCLDPGWFSSSGERSARWAREGVSVDEACSRLNTRMTTVYPIASEMAEWLYRNWTAEQINTLGSSYRDYVLRHFSSEDDETLEPWGYRDGLRLALKEDLPNTCLLRHKYDVSFKTLGTFYTALVNGRLTYGDIDFSSVEDWLLTVRAKAWNEEYGKTNSVDSIKAAGHFDGNWWEHIEVMREGNWLKVTKAD